MCVSAFAFIDNIATGGLSPCCSDSRSPVSFYSRRMEIIYTCSQGHSPHIYYTSLTGCTANNSGHETGRGVCEEEKGKGKF